ncbi:MAG: hypothetical protein AAFQ87_02755 [Bacteroidota bacterium]
MTTTKRLDLLLLIGSWAVFLFFVALLMIPDGQRPMVEAHPDFPILTKSAHRISDNPIAYSLGIGLVFSIIGLMAVLVLMGNRKSGRFGTISKWLGGGMLLYAVAWGIMLVSYGQYQQSPETSFWGGFPAPTAWMLYVVWFWPIVPMGIYFAHFKGWIWRSEDQTRFEQLVQQQKEQTDG